jgi:arginase
MVATGLQREASCALALVGAPVEGGANMAGSALGPSALRTIGLPRMLAKLGWEVIDQGDLVPVARSTPASVQSDEHLRKSSEVARWIRCLSTAAHQLARVGHVPVFLGGDHSMSMGTVDGIARACAENGSDLFVLWLDAHADFNTPATSPSGNPHGMSLAFLCGESGFDRLLPVPPYKVVDPRKVFLLGTHSVDAGENEVIRHRGVNVIDMCEIGEHGVAAPMLRILRSVAEHDGVLHVSLDADFVDPAFIPAVNVPVPGGVTYAEAHLIMEMLKESGRVVSLDVAEFNPLFDVDGRGARALAELVGRLFDRKSEGRHDYSRRESRYDHSATRVN